MDSSEGPPQRAAALSLPGRITVAATLGAVAVAALYHLAMVFLHVAPSNTLSKEHAAAVSDYIYPEFEQNWKLFAPDPLQQNVHVQARAEVTRAGGPTMTGWVDLTGADIAAMRHQPFPSHSQQNELRRAWGFYTDTHDGQEQATAGDRSDLSRSYLLRIVEQRFGPTPDGGRLIRVQVRAATTAVPQPPWMGGTGVGAPSYRQLPWWPVDRTAGTVGTVGMGASATSQENAS